MIESYPLHWPLSVPRTKDPQRSRFGRRDGVWTKSLTVAQSIERLLGEINRMTKVGQKYRVQPSSVIISTNLPTRKDGFPYSNAREPEDSGVAVYFDLDNEKICLPCDRWDRVADNIAAIAAHIKATRDIERWGVADLKTAFAGFKALPENGSPAVTKSWWEILGVEPNAKYEQIRTARNKLAMIYHPDVPETGDEDKFKEIENAYKKAKKAFV